MKLIKYNRLRRKMGRRGRGECARCFDLFSCVCVHHESDLTCFADVFFQEPLHVFFARQLKLVLGNEQAVVHAGQGVLDQGMVLLRTQQDADREIVAVGHHVLAIPTDVGVELADILVGEVLNLQIDQHMALQNPVIEDKIDKTIGVTDQNPFLPGLETEAMTEFQQEVL